MITQLTRPVILLVVALFGLAATPLAHGQVPRKEGIDLVLLVDVSMSMYQLRDQAERTGNDPQRIRWDAVLLALTLLTSEDQAVVLPFNSEVPARVARIWSRGTWPNWPMASSNHGRRPGRPSWQELPNSIMMTIRALPGGRMSGTVTSAGRQSSWRWKRPGCD